MNETFLKLLACPNCASEVTLSDDGDHAPTVRCSSCNSTYEIRNGIPRLNEALKEHQLTTIAETFGYEWKAHHRGEFESQTLFGRTRDEDWAMVKEGMRITDSDVEGAIVLDAGCGSGRFAQLFADHGAAFVVGVDINEAVDEAAWVCREYDNIQIVQGNIFALPFRAGAFDLIWCNGVIHHTPDARGAHKSLARHVRPGGVLYVWVYIARFNPFRFVKSSLRLLQLHRWPPRLVQGLAVTMAYLSLPILAVYRLARTLPPLRPRSAWGRRTVRPRTAEELKLTWFDTLSPEFETRHTEDEVVGWFAEAGFRAIETLEEPKVGVRGAAPDRT